MKNIHAKGIAYIVPAIIALAAIICIFPQVEVASAMEKATPDEFAPAPAPIPIKPVNGQFIFPQSRFAGGRAVFYVYNHSPKESVKFFVVKSVDNVIRAAFDACDVCYKHKMGYAQTKKGDHMVCMSCGLKFRTDKVNEVTGGCNPGALNRTLKDGNVIITVQAVLSGLRYFQ